MAFTDSFNDGSQPRDLHTYSANWSYSTAGSGPYDNATGNSAALQTTSGSAIKTTNVGTETWYACPDQGLSGNKQYVRAKMQGTITPNNQLRLTCLADVVLQDAVILTIHTSNVLLLRHIVSGTPSTLGTDNQAVVSGDVIGLEVSGTTPNLVAKAYINGVLRLTSSTFANASTSTRQGFQIQTGQSGINPWLTNFEAGAGAFPGTASGAAAVAEIAASAVQGH